MENKVLLSQDEVDVLIRFLNAQKDTIGGEVLEQESVDKLLTLLRTGNGGQKLYYDTKLPKLKDGSGTAIMVLAGEENIGKQQADCRLECEVDKETGYVRIICVNKETGNRYKMTPTCLEQVRYVSEDSSEWGYVIPPLTFDNVAALLQVKYTKETFDTICGIYAEKVFGDKTHSIPSIYMPAAHDLILHLMM